MRRLTTRQVRYLWAIGVFQKGKKATQAAIEKALGAGSKKQSSPETKGEAPNAPKPKSKSPKQTKAESPKMMTMEETLTGLIKAVAGVPAGLTKKGLQIGKDLYQIKHQPDSTPKFKAMLKDSKGETWGVGSLRDDIEKHGAKIVDHAKAKKVQASAPDFDRSTSDADNKKFADEIKKSLSETHPEIDLKVNTPHFQGVMKDLGVSTAQELIEKLAPEYDKIKSSGNQKTFLVIHTDPDDRMHEIGFSNPKFNVTRSYNFDLGIAHHEQLSLDDSLQGQGIGKKMYDSHLALAKSMGMKQISLTANCDVGGYMWAKQGFDWSGPDDQAHFERQVSKRMKTQQDQLIGHTSLSHWTDDEKDKFRRFLIKPRTPKEISEFSLGDRKLGQEALLGSSWSGVKKL